MEGKNIPVRCVGTTSVALRAPIIRRGNNLDELEEIVVDVISYATETKQIVPLKEKDIIAITESIVAKGQGNFVTFDDIAIDLKKKYNGAKEIGVIFPIFSRNRFAKVLEGLAKAFEKIYIQLSLPCDEVGNYMISEEKFREAKLDDSKIYTLQEMYQIFGALNHEITGVDYAKLYQESCEGKAEIFFCNDPTAILKYTNNILVSDIHKREKTKAALRGEGRVIYGLDDIMNEPINESGYNPEFGLLGSNLSSEGELKLFPRDCFEFVNNIQTRIQQKYGICVEVMVYGDGAYKDPTSKIWELADPLVCPGYTKGLEGSPNEIKLKYVADNELQGISQQEAQEQMKEIIRSKTDNKSKRAAGTTPREYTSLLGTLADLMSGSGDKGTPIVLIKDYFSNYADD